MLQSFFLSLGIVFVAELGDKSQLLALTFASRYRAVQVLVGVAVAAGIMFGLSVAVGSLAAEALPQNLIDVIAGLAFIGFGAWTLRGDDDGDDAAGTESRRYPIVTVALAFLLAELGDKTMLATITLASTQDPLGTFLGATTGMVAADALAVMAGRQLGARLPQRAVRIGAAVVFWVFGVVLLARGFT